MNLPVLLVLLAYILTVSVHGQPGSGFINIDCGKRDSYNDTLTGLFYVTDSGYVDTGENHELPSGLQNTQFYLQSYDLRSFPNGTRNCYTLPAKLGYKYLIRAFFMYGNYDGLDSIPEFDLYLGTTLWSKIYMTNSSVNYNTEILAIASANSFSVCLVNIGLGVPFISSLELRPLKDNLYQAVNSSRSLVLFGRNNYQPTVNTVIRYPNDIYDRIWRPTPAAAWDSLVAPSPVNVGNNFEPPSDVMNTAGTPANRSSMNITWIWSVRSSGISPDFFFALHFAELQSLAANQSRLFNISVNGVDWAGLISPSYLMITTLHSGKPEPHDKLTFSIYKAKGSTLPPILNAIEIYIARQMTDLATRGGDVDAIMNIRALHHVKRNWMGDPCAPKSLAWDGLNCSYDDSSNQSRIISLSLNSTGLTGGIPAAIANLTQLESLDLSNNSLNGSIPDFLADLSHLNFLDLSNNRLSGSIPVVLQERSASGVLKLSIANNPELCNNSDQCGKSTKKSSSKTVVAVVAAVLSVVILIAVVLIIVWKVRRGPKEASYGTGKNKAQARPNASSFRIPSFHSESRHFTYAELVTITNNFRTSIGKGGFGVVYHGVQESDFQVAVKLLSQSSSQGAKEFQTEAQLLTRIHHRNLVSLVGYCNDSNQLALVYEYMGRGNLESHLSGEASSSTTLFWRDRLRIAVESAQGLEYLHKGCKPAIVHRDVKSSNILLTDNLEARIADFGLSKIFDNDAVIPMSTIVMGTPGYLDPEYYISNMLNEKSDVYSFGVVLFELITGLPAILKTEGNVHLLKWVETRVARGEISEIVDPRFKGEYDTNAAWKAVEIALACTASASIGRPTMTEVLMLLKECLELETPNVSSQNSSQTNFRASRHTSIEVCPAQSSTITGPLAR